MSEEITIEFAGLDEAGRKLGAVMRDDVIKRSLTQSSWRLADWSGYARLSGPRPEFLGVVTNRLRSSIAGSRTVKRGNEYIARIGTNVEYAAIHEFGGLTGRNHTTMMPARPFLRPSLEDAQNKQDVLDNLVHNIDEAIQRAK